MIYIFAAIGAASLARWAYRHRNNGSALPGVLKPRHWAIYP